MNKWLLLISVVSVPLLSMDRVTDEPSKNILKIEEGKLVLVGPSGSILATRQLATIPMTWAGRMHQVHGLRENYCIYSERSDVAKLTFHICAVSKRTFADIALITVPYPHAHIVGESPTYDAKLVGQGPGAEDLCMSPLFANGMVDMFQGESQSWRDF